MGRGDRKKVRWAHDRVRAKKQRETGKVKEARVTKKGK